ncbi:AAA-domain-containing protein [Xylariaceae sp. FL0016]|nr:AAA-domain-containing protein [Xylariaceae sp. FL0016]
MHRGRSGPLLRAFRSAALKNHHHPHHHQARQQQPTPTSQTFCQACRASSSASSARNASQGSTRSFHASARAGAREGAPGEGNTGANGGKSDKGVGEGVGTGAGERERDNVSTDAVSGEKDAKSEAKAKTDDGDAPASKRVAGGGGLRARLQRNRRSDMPPVPIPRSFARDAVYRYDPEGSGPETVRVGEEQLMNATVGNWALGSIGAVLDELAWTSESVEEVVKVLESGDPEQMDRVKRRCSLLSQAAFWATADHTHSFYASVAPGARFENVTQLVDEMAKAAAADELGVAVNQRDLYLPQHLRGSSALEPEHARRIVERLMDGPLVDGRYEPPMHAVYHPHTLDEVEMAIRGDLTVQPPKGKRAQANFQRPVTVINEQEYAGHSMPRAVLRHVANRLEADVLHLRASDIAYIVGNYIGQDVARAPGDISHLGYKAAENSERCRVRSSRDGDSSDDAANLTSAMTIVFGRPEDDRGSRKSGKNITMEDLVSGNRGKNDEIWSDIKINYALRELIDTAKSDKSDVRPLIVHLDDFHALNMDSNGGAMMITKLRKVIDELWFSGKKIVLVGSCSGKDSMNATSASKYYSLTLKELELKERVIHIHPTTDALHFHQLFKGWSERDFLHENDINLTRMLLAMVEPDAKHPVLSEGVLGLAKTESRHLPWLWQTTVLPAASIYNFAMAMIGTNRGATDDLFTVDATRATAEALSLYDGIREQHQRERSARPKKDKSHMESASDFSFPRERRNRPDPFAENHEERLMSGLVNADDIRTTFKDVHASKETIDSIKMLTTLSLVRPEAFAYGVLANDRIPGALLYGPPGTGKTLLAKAVAKESGANMIEVSAASINAMYVGESEKNVRALFRLAKKKEPMVIFIDEADALLSARSSSQEKPARRETINQFLREWDGMDNMKAFILVATNRPFDLDEAVLRRLPRKLLIDLPREADRAAILRIHLKGETLDEAVSLEALAKRTPLYSGSDLKNLCVAAAMAAVKEEMEAAERHEGPGAYVYAAKRVLGLRHFDKALKEIGASVSEDMGTLKAIQKFDASYGGVSARKKKKGMGFEVVVDEKVEERARVRGGS